MSQPDPRVFHFTDTTGRAACGQRLGHGRSAQHLGNSARGLLQVAEQYAGQTCGHCAELASERLSSRLGAFR